MGYSGDRSMIKLTGLSNQLQNTWEQSILEQHKMKVTVLETICSYIL